MRKVKERNCPCCEADMIGRHPTAKYCSKECRLVDWRVKNPEKGQAYRKTYYNKNKSSQKKYKECSVCNTSIPALNTYCSSCKPKPKSYYKKKGPQYFEKVCGTCGGEFTAKSKLAKYCKVTCRPSHKEANKLRKRTTRKAKLSVESWGAISKFKENRPENCHLDHIIPLNHPDVCGLHNTWNFQWLSDEDNMKKSNDFDGTRDNSSWYTPDTTNVPD